MRRFLIRRFFASFVSLIGATAVVFLLSRAAGDPILLYAKPAGYGMSPERIENLHKKLGLDKPVPVQYVVWLGQVIRGDLGKTLQSEQPVRKVIWEKMPATAQLALAGWLVALGVGVPIGMISAVKRGSVWDYLGFLVDPGRYCGIVSGRTTGSFRLLAQNEVIFPKRGELPCPRGC